MLETIAGLDVTGCKLEDWGLLHNLCSKTGPEWQGLRCKCYRYVPVVVVRQAFCLSKLSIITCKLKGHGVSGLKHVRGCSQTRESLGELVDYYVLTGIENVDSALDRRSSSQSSSKWRFALLTLTLSKVFWAPHQSAGVCTVVFAWSKAFRYSDNLLMVFFIGVI